MESVYSAVRTGSLYKADYVWSLNNRGGKCLQRGTDWTSQPTSFFSILSPAQYWVSSTNHLTTSYAVSSIPPLPRPSSVQIFSSTPCSQTLSFLSSRNVSDQFSHPYKTTGKIIVLYILIFKFLGSNLEDKRFCLGTPFSKTVNAYSINTKDEVSSPYKRRKCTSLCIGKFQTDLREPPTPNFHQTYRTIHRICLQNKTRQFSLH